MSSPSEVTNRTHSGGRSASDDKYAACSPVSHATLVSVLLDFRLKYSLKSLPSAAGASSEGVNYQTGITVNLWYWPRVTKSTTDPSSIKAGNCPELGRRAPHIEREAGWLGDLILQL